MASRAYLVFTGALHNSVYAKLGAFNPVVYVGGVYSGFSLRVIFLGYF
jgi:hypothetical protein